MNQQGSVVLLDGGMGQELLLRSGLKPVPLWSAAVMTERPELVRDIHADFIRAGARVITLNTYSVTPERLDKSGVGDQFETLQRSAIRMAHEAREMCAVDEVRIAGCLPPLVASYRPDLTPDFSVAHATYRKIVAEQADHVDLFMCETMSSTGDARAAATAAMESGKPVWVALSVKDDGSGDLRSGESLREACEMLSEFGIEAALLNCSKPECISAVFNVLATSGAKTGAYANGFTSIDNLQPQGTVDSLQARNDLGPDAYADFALSWVKEGAAIVGGCCEVGPGHIARLAQRLENDQYAIVNGGGR